MYYLVNCLFQHRQNGQKRTGLSVKTEKNVGFPLPWAGFQRSCNNLSSSQISANFFLRLVQRNKDPLPKKQTCIAKLIANSYAPNMAENTRDLGAETRVERQNYVNIC